MQQTQANAWLIGKTERQEVSQTFVVPQTVALGQAWLGTPWVCALGERLYPSPPPAFSVREVGKQPGNGSS